MEFLLSRPGNLYECNFNITPLWIQADIIIIQAVPDVLFPYANQALVHFPVGTQVSDNNSSRRLLILAISKQNINRLTGKIP